MKTIGLLLMAFAAHSVAGEMNDTRTLSYQPWQAQAKMYAPINGDLSYVGTLLFHQRTNRILRMNTLNLTLMPGKYVVRAYKDNDAVQNCPDGNCSAQVIRPQSQCGSSIDLFVIEVKPTGTHEIYGYNVTWQLNDILNSMIQISKFSTFHIATCRNMHRSLAFGNLEILATTKLYFNDMKNGQYAGNLVFTSSSRIKGVTIDDSSSAIIPGHYKISIHYYTKNMTSCDSLGPSLSWSPGVKFAYTSVSSNKDGRFTKLFLPGVSLELNHPKRIIGHYLVIHKRTIELSEDMSVGVTSRRAACGIITY